MIVYLANKTQFREDILSNRIEEIVHVSFKGLIVDDAHRLNEKSGLFSNLGENQTKELIHSRHRTGNIAA